MTTAQRFELRLDRHRRERLAELSQRRGVPASEVLRQLIDEACADAGLLDEPHAALQRLLALPRLPVPDPETLKRELDSQLDEVTQKYLDTSA